MFTLFYFVCSKSTHCALYFAGGDLSILCHYEEHKSLAYGADWCRLDLGTLTDSSPHKQTQSTEASDCLATTETPECDTKVTGLSEAINTLDCGSKSMEKEYVISTCSFYDHLLKLWTLKL